jgi:hypothetical protein
MSFHDRQSFKPLIQVNSTKSINNRKVLKSINDFIDEHRQHTTNGSNEEGGISEDVLKKLEQVSECLSSTSKKESGEQKSSKKSSKRTRQIEEVGTKTDTEDKDDLADDDDSNPKKRKKNKKKKASD